MSNVLILGGGFSGVIAAERLSLALGAQHEITLISENREFIFYPALAQLAFGKCRPADVVADLHHKLQAFRTRFVQAEVVGIDPHKRKVRVTGKDIDGEIAYDFLIIALGRRLATEKTPGFFERAHHILDVKGAERFGEALRNFHRGNIVIGMCPEGFLPVPVCETAFAISRLVKKSGENLITNLSVVFPGTIEEAFGGAHIAHELTEAFVHHGIETITDFRVAEVAEKEILGESGKSHFYDLLMLVPSFRGHGFLQDLGITDERGFVKVNGLMQVHGLEHVYAAGDGVAFTGPKLGHMAVRQGHIAAHNVIEEVNGRTPDHEYYHEIATVIDAGDADSIYLHYGIWDDNQISVQQGLFWHWAKGLHDRFWQAVHR
jgi:sulfide:quinone oxidoreductase